MAGPMNLAMVNAMCVGRRVELASHLDAFMRGARFGTVTRVTYRGLTVVTDRGRLKLTGLTDGDIAEWID